MVAHARAAAGSPEHGARGDEGLDVAERQRLLQHLARCRDDHQARAGRNPPHPTIRLAQDRGGSGEILQPAIRAGAEKRLIDVRAEDLRQRRRLRRVVRRGDYRLQLAQVDECAAPGRTRRDRDRARRRRAVRQSAPALSEVPGT